MELEHYGWPTRRVGNSHNASTVVGVVNKLHRRRVFVDNKNAASRGEIF